MEVERGEHVREKKITLSELGREYFASETTKRSLRRDEQIMVRLNAAFGDRKLADIGVLDIKKYRTARLETVTPATVNREVALLKHLFNLADDWGKYRGRNPVKGLRFLDEGNLRFRTVSMDEEAALLQHAPPRLAELITFSINTGLRSSDTLSLTWEEVDFERKVIRKKVQKTQKMLTLPLNPVVLSVLRRREACRHKEYVFYNPETGGPWKDVWHGLKKICPKAGLGDDVNWNTFRHTFATRLLRAGANIVTVKTLMGHSSIKVTERYLEEVFEDSRSAVCNLPVPNENQRGCVNSVSEVERANAA